MSMKQFNLNLHAFLYSEMDPFLWLVLYVKRAWDGTEGPDSWIEGYVLRRCEFNRRDKTIGSNKIAFLDNARPSTLVRTIQIPSTFRFIYYDTLEHLCEEHVNELL